MNYVYNEQRNEEMRHILMMQPTVEESRKKIEEDESDPRAWYEYATALGLEARYDECIEAYSHGIACNPFYAPNYFGRGRKLNYTGRYWAAVADFTMAISLDSMNWTYWYYRATTQNLAGYIEESIEDFRQCIKYTAPHEHYPLVHWIYTSYIEIGKFEEAKAALELTDCSAVAPQMDYGYCRSVQLYKGIVKPEEFIDIPAMEKAVLPRERRVELELNGMYYGLYNFWTLHGDAEKAKDALIELQKVQYDGAFGNTKGMAIAKKLGIVE